MNLERVAPESTDIVSSQGHISASSFEVRLVVKNTCLVFRSDQVMESWDNGSNHASGKEAWVILPWSQRAESPQALSHGLCPRLSDPDLAKRTIPLMVYSATCT